MSGHPFRGPRTGVGEGFLPTRPHSWYLANRDRILPQVVPPALLEYCRWDGRQLVTVSFVEDLAVTFVLDDVERYYYITAATAGEWGVEAPELLAVALDNLRRISAGMRWKQIGVGARAMFLCETFDGYDASRVLLSRELVHLAGLVSGNLVLALPHRDYLVAAGDSDPDFLEEFRLGVQEDFANSRYPITPNLFHFRHGRIIPYGSGTNDVDHAN